MKTKNIFLFASSLALAGMLSASCSNAPVSNGHRVDALDNAAWEASEWISAADAQVVTQLVPDERWLAADGSSWFVSTVKNGRKVASAKWMTSGLGTFDIYVNGVLVGEEFLKPGFTHYLKTKYSFTYDVTDMMNAASGAENVFSAVVSPGWWADKIITPGDTQGMNGDKCAFRGVLELTYADGTSEYFGTDTENWKAGIAGPVTHAAIFDGEYYDARIQPGYETVEKLGKPEVNTEFQGEIHPTAGAEIFVNGNHSHSRFYPLLIFGT